MFPEETVWIIVALLVFLLVIRRQESKSTINPGPPSYRPDPPPSPWLISKLHDESQPDPCSPPPLRPPVPPEAEIFLNRKEILKAQELRIKFGYWCSHTLHDTHEWCSEVENGAIRQGYWEWVAGRILQEQDDDT